MLEKIFWDVFQNTGNIEAYLASKECSNCRYNLEISKELFPQINSVNKDDNNIKKDE